ncbi:unnamed protein product, partial [Polarella glacialis]
MMLLVDGDRGVGKSSLINALLLDAELSATPSASSSVLPVGQPSPLNTVGRPLLIVRSPFILRAETSDSGVKAEGAPHGRRLLEGRPSLQDQLRVLSEEEWLERLSGGTGDEEQLPLILEDQRAPAALGASGMWLTELHFWGEGEETKSKWVTGCRDVIFLARAAGGGRPSRADEEYLQRHLDCGRSVLLIVNHCDAVDLEPHSLLPADLEDLLRKQFAQPERGELYDVLAVSLLHSADT